MKKHLSVIVVSVFLGCSSIQPISASLQITQVYQNCIPPDLTDLRIKVGNAKSLLATIRKKYPTFEKEVKTLTSRLDLLLVTASNPICIAREDPKRALAEATAIQVGIVGLKSVVTETTNLVSRIEKLTSKSQTGSTSKSQTGSNYKLTVQINMLGDAFFERTAGSGYSVCVSGLVPLESGKYFRITLGSTIKVVNESNKTIGLGKISSTSFKIGADSRFPDFGYCIFKGVVTVNKAQFYKLMVDGRNGPDYSFAELKELKWEVDLSL